MTNKSIGVIFVQGLMMGGRLYSYTYPDAF